MKPNMVELEKRLKTRSYFSTIGLAPHPFPGNYPTRVYWRVNTTWYYGKPHIYQMRRFNKLYREIAPDSLKLVVRYLEFDKLSPLEWYRGQWSSDHNLCTAYFPKNTSALIGNNRDSRKLLDFGAIKVYWPTLRICAPDDFKQYISWYEETFGKPTKAWCFPESQEGIEL